MRPMLEELLGSSGLGSRLAGGGCAEARFAARKTVVAIRLKVRIVLP